MAISPNLRRLEVAAAATAGALLAAGATLLAYDTTALAPLALAGGMGVAALAVWRPIVAVCAALALAPLDLIAAIDVGIADLSPLEAVFIIAAASWAVARVLGGHSPIVRTPLTLPFLLLLAVSVPGLVTASDSLAVAKIIVMWGTFLLVFQLVVAEADPRGVRTLLFALGLSAAAVAVPAVLEAGGAGGPAIEGVGERASGRAQGALGHPNTLATFEALALPGAVALALRGPAAWRPFALASAVLILAGAGLSLSRGGLLAIAGALAVMLLWGPFRRLVLVAALVLAAVVAGAGNPLGELQVSDAVSKRISSIGYAAEGTDPRFIVWAGVPEIVADHPLVGVGQNAFPDVAPGYGLVWGELGESSFAHAHNIPLTIAAELGLIGLALLAWLAVALARVLVRAYRRSQGLERGLAVALAAAFVALALQGMVDYTVRSNVVAAATLVLAGCAVVLSRPQDSSS